MTPWIYLKTLMYRSISLIFLLFSHFLIVAQSKVLDPSKSISQYSMKVWTAEDGLPSISLTDLLQADDEYIWIATYNGLSRFDGLNFVNFSIENVPSMHSNAITTLAYNDGILWVGSHRGIIRYKDGVFSEEKGLSEIASTSIEKIIFDSKGRMWIGTTSEGLYCYESNKLRKLGNPLLERSPIGAIAEDKTGTVWVGADKGEIFKYQGNDLRLVYNSDQIVGVSVIFTDKLGVTWVCTDNGIYTLTNGILIKNEELSGGRDFRDITQDDYGNIWLADNQGIVRRHTADRKERFSEEQGLPNNLIRKMLFDHQGNLWIASYRSGLFQLTDGTFTTYSNTEGLSGSVVTSIIEFSPEEYWIASEGGHIDVLKNDKMSSLDIKGELPSARLKQLMKDSKGHVWVSTYGGLLKLNSKGEIQPLPTALKSIDNYVRMTFEDKKGNIWIGTRRTGIYLLDWHGQLEHFDTKSGLSSNFIMSIDQAPNGDVLVGTKNGINVFQGNKLVEQINKEAGLPTNFIFDLLVSGDVFWIGTDLGLVRYDRITKQSTLYNTNNGLNENIVFDIKEDEDGFFWMTSNSGVIRTEKAQLNAYAEGKLKSISVRLFNRSDGMKSEQCVGATKILQDRKGRLWIPTVVGVSSILPTEIANTAHSYRTIIEVLTTENEVFQATNEIDIAPGKGKRIQISFTAFDYISPKKVSFKYRLRPFDTEWQFVSGRRYVDYTNLPPDNYVFEVLPHDEKSLEKKAVTTVKFKIQAFFYQTKWFYALIVLLFILSTYFIYKYRLNQVKVREQELQRRVAERTREVVNQRDHIQEQSEKIEMAYEELKGTQLQLVESEKMASLGQLTAGIAHELNNPINFVFAGINSLKVQVNDILELIELYGKLDHEDDKGKIKAIKEEIAELKEDLEFDEVPEDISGLIQDIEQGAERTAEIVKSLRVFTRADEVDSFQLTDLHDVLNSTLIILRNIYKDRVSVIKEYEDLPMVSCNVGKISQVFTNIIANAIDAIEEKGKVVIRTSAFKANGEFPTLEQGRKYVEVKISDTGTGIAENHLSTIFEPFFTTKNVGDGTGLGLSISKGIVEKHYGQILVNSTLGEGSAFSVIIPVEQEGNENQD